MLPLVFALIAVLSGSFVVYARPAQVTAPVAISYVSGNSTASSRIYLTDYMKGTPGVFSEEAEVKSNDNMLDLTFPAGTKGETKEGWALSYITMEQIPAAEQSLPEPVGGTIVGPSYALGPEGTTFNPPATITMHYDGQNFPQDINEGSLVIGYWDGQTNQWAQLKGSTVDTGNYTVSAPLTHFSTYAILGYPPAPASFSVSSLSVSPTQTTPGQDVTIDAAVTNTGGSSGSYLVLLKLDGLVVNSREVTLSAGESAPVEFKVDTAILGKHNIDVSGNDGQFTIIEPEGTIAELPSANITNPPQTREPVAANTPTSTAASETPAAAAVPAKTFPIKWMVLVAAAAFILTLAITLTINKNNRF